MKRAAPVVWELWRDWQSCHNRTRAHVADHRVCRSSLGFPEVSTESDNVG